MWIGFRHKGLAHLKDGRLIVITARQGLYEDHVAQIVPDDRGWLWFGSDHGIFKIRLSELNDFADGKIPRVHSVHYGGDEGLPLMQAKTGVCPSSMASSDGRLWMIIAGDRVGHHSPGTGTRVSSPPPPVYIERMVVDEKAIDARDYFTNLAGMGEGGKSTPAPTGLPPLAVRFHRTHV